MDTSLKTLSNTRILEGGQRVAFTVERQDGKQLDLSCPTTELADIIGFLAGVGFQASTVDSLTPGQLSAVRIPSSGIGFGHSTPNETLLMVNLRSFQLVFPISNSDLIRLADDVSRIARTLTADLSKKN